MARLSQFHGRRWQFPLTERAAFRGQASLQSLQHLITIIIEATEGVLLPQVHLLP